MENKKLVCKICGTEFNFTAGEQQFYLDRVLSPPARCSECRPSARRERNRREEVKNGEVYKDSEPGTVKP